MLDEPNSGIFEQCSRLLSDVSHEMAADVFRLSSKEADTGKSAY